jgi:voltage-gated potassium channel Kch
MAAKTDSFLGQQARATAAIAGITKYYSATATLLMAGVSYTPAQLIAILQAYVAAITALVALHAELHDAVLAGKLQRKQVQAILLALEAFVVNQFGSNSSALNDFGFAPKKRAVETAATKAAAQAKGRATREAKKPAPAPVTSGAGSTAPKA